MASGETPSRGQDAVRTGEPGPRVVVLAGGVGGSRFVVGVRAALAARRAPEAIVVVNTGDDLWLSGVRLQPDVDSIVYALAEVNDTDRGWGRADDTERVNAELQAWGAGWPWFTLGDLDLGTHVARTGWLREGLTPSEVLTRLSQRWPLGVRLLPMTDAEVDTIVVVRRDELEAASSAGLGRISGVGAENPRPDGGIAPQTRGVGEARLHFQEWWTRYRASLPPVRFENPGIADAAPAPGVAEAIATADVVLLAPSNPVVSIGPILAVPGIAAAIRATTAAVVGVSPIIGGRVVRGMADVCLAAIGVDTQASAVAAFYGARTTGGLLDAWLLAEEDARLAPDVAAAGIRPVVAPLWMTDAAASASLADAALQAAGV